MTSAGDLTVTLTAIWAGSWTWAGFEFHLWYVIPVVLALLLGSLFPVTKHIRETSLRRQYYVLQGITLVSAIVGAKLTFVVAEIGWPWEPWPGWSVVLASGRSIVGALVFGLLGAECAKPLLKYPLPPNDRFAAILPLSIAIGRIGCLANGCCRGVPYDGIVAIRYDDGITRHPAPLYEMAFHLAACAVALVLVRRNYLKGCVFSVYLMAYGVFRFGTEFLRETPKTFATLSAYQWLALAMVVLGVSFLAKRYSKWNVGEAAV